jgi:transmembrane sensor
LTRFNVKIDWAMNKLRFTHLMDRHLEGSATPEEFRELTTLLRTGEYREEISDLFFEIAKARMNVTGSGADAVDQLFGQIDAVMSVHDNAEDAGQVLPNQLSFLPRMAPNMPEPVEEKEKEEDGTLSLGSYASWLKVAAMAVVALGVSFYVFQKSPEALAEEATTELVKKSSFTTISGENYFRLPDGSTVQLNAGSELSYGDSFGVDNREVILYGQAFFDVKHDPAHTFTVHSGSVTTQVLGTAFDVKAYPDQKEVVVTVVRGKVRVSDETHTIATITPNQQVIVNVNTREAQRVVVDATTELAWKEPYIILDNVNVTAALKIVSDKYKTPIRIEGNALNGCQVTSVFLHHENLDDVLNVITRSFNASYTRKNGVIVIRGGACM